MGPFEMVAIIVVATCVAGVVKSWLKHKGGGAAQLSAEQEARISQLEARVRELEAAVADPDAQLRDQFRTLERS